MYTKLEIHSYNAVKKPRAKKIIPKLIKTSQMHANVPKDDVIINELKNPMVLNKPVA